MGKNNVQEFHPSFHFSLKLPCIIIFTHQEHNNLLKWFLYLLAIKGVLPKNLKGLQTFFILKRDPSYEKGWETLIYRVSFYIYGVSICCLICLLRWTACMEMSLYEYSLLSFSTRHRTFFHSWMLQSFGADRGCQNTGRTRAIRHPVKKMKN